MTRASNGDTIVVRGGVHPGPLVVRKSVRLVGEGRPVIDGRGQGTVVQLEAPGCLLRGFTIRASGDLLSTARTSACSPRPPTCVIEDNTLEDVLFGIYLRQAPRSVVRGNRLHGKDLPVATPWRPDPALVQRRRDHRGQHDRRAGATSSCGTRST